MWNFLPTPGNFNNLGSPLQQLANNCLYTVYKYRVYKYRVYYSIFIYPLWTITYSVRLEPWFQLRSDDGTRYHYGGGRFVFIVVQQWRNRTEEHVEEG
jgi:hypothetical protein